jgi:hypothetical protein
LRAIAAVAVLSVRAAIRSRVVIALVLLLAAGIFGIPRLVSGDGSSGSEWQIRLHYTLFASVVVLGLATLWAACAAFGLEIDSRRMELTAVKPVRLWTLWLGRWLGILILDAVLLTGVAIAVRLQVMPLARHDAAGPAATDLLCSRAVARPLLPPIEVEAQQVFAQLRQEGRLPPDEKPERLLRTLILQGPYRCFAIHPGESVAWQFRLSPAVPADGRFWIRVKFDTGGAALADVRGLCRVRRTGGSEWATEIPVNDLVCNELLLPVTALSLAGATALELSFLSRAESGSAPLLVQPRHALALLTTQGTFNGNLARAMLSQLAILAALAALGLTLGACFSFPVASFVATALLVAVLAVPQDARDLLPPMLLSGEARTGVIQRVSLDLNRGLFAVIHPLVQPEPLEHLVAGERVPTAELVRMWCWGGVLYPLVLALLAGGVLRRRELVRQLAGG